MMEDRLAWWREARFGLFIHFGLYAIPAGVWKGREVPGIGEQIMRFAEIPASEYGQLAREFNPVDFDADAIVRMAVDAGMGYLVVTAKHHDGFALFKSDVDSFNVVDATPFGRDIVAELAKACAKAGIRFCIYYSQRQDWHHPDGFWNEWPGQHPVPVGKRGFDFNRCMEQKCLPQMRELLTRFGPVGLVWYDTPVDSTEAQSRKFFELVHELQPDCLVCDRVGNGHGDYAVLGDNEFPYCRHENMDGEVPATMNHTWGFKQSDSDWKGVKKLLYSLVRSASNGCNYLLNIGPKADGSVPPESAERLRAVGEWMRVNGEAVRGAGVAPFPNPFPWGMATAKGNRLHLVFSDWPGAVFELGGLESRVLKATLLADPGRNIPVEQDCDASGMVKNRLVLRGLPERAPDGFFPVIRLELDGVPRAERVLAPSDDGTIHLFSGNAQVERAGEDSALAIDRKGLPTGFREGSGSLAWTFAVERPGRYRVEALTVRHWSRDWIDGIQVEAEVGGTRWTAPLTPDAALENIQSKYHPETLSRIGEIDFRRPGMQTLKLSVAEMPNSAAGDLLCEDLSNDRSLNLIELRLVPEDGNT